MDLAVGDLLGQLLDLSLQLVGNLLGRALVAIADADEARGQIGHPRRSEARIVAGDEGLDGLIDGVSDLLLHGADDDVRVDVLLVGVDADGIEALLLGGLEHAVAAGRGNLEDHVRTGVVERDRAVLADRRIVIGHGVVVVDRDLLAVLGAVVLRTLLIADDEVVDRVGVLTADRADRAVGRHGRRNVTGEERAFILGIGDVQNVRDRLGGRVVDPDPLHVGIIRRDGLDVVELPADADDDVRAVGGVLHLCVVVFVVALDRRDLHAEIGGQTVGALLGGVIERAVAEFARHDQCQLGRRRRVGRGLSLVLGLAAAGQQAEHQNRREE